MRITREEAERFDREDPFAALRAEFALPGDVIYLDGNSLGPLPKRLPERIAHHLSEEWGHRLIHGWSESGWIDLPRRVGARIAPLIGAGAEEVLAADSTSANLYKLAAAASQAQPDRTTILTEERNFPTDGYMLEGLARLATALGGRLSLRRVPRAALIDAIDGTTALVALTHVDYRSSEMWDMAPVAAAARAAGAFSLFDLSHSVGAVPVDLNGAGVDLAVGCGYKFLNGGPGAPAFLFVAARHHARLISPLAGWMGHRAPFDFSRDYAPAPGIDRFACGTPPISGLVALEGALELFEGMDLALLHRKAMRLCDIFRGEIEGLPSVRFLSPANTGMRGAHVALAHADAASLIAGLAAQGVIGDFRPPDIMRFGFGALYLRHVEAHEAGRRLAALLRETGQR
ncbi:MAG: kynureninase [Rhodothalassiaceae bacterium]